MFLPMFLRYNTTIPIQIQTLSPGGKTRHDARAYLMTYLKEFSMKLKIRQQAGLRSLEHRSRLGGPSPWGGGRESRFSMAKWLRLGRRGSTNPIHAAPSDPKTRQHPRGGRPQEFSWEAGSARDAASGGSFNDLAFEEGRQCPVRSVTTARWATASRLATPGSRRGNPAIPAAAHPDRRT